MFFFLKGWWEKKEGGERWRDKQRGISSFCSEYIFAVSWWRRSRRRQKAQFLFSRTIKTGLPSLPLLPPSSAFVFWARQVRRSLKEVLFWARFINGSKPPRSCSPSHKSFSRWCYATQTERWVFPKTPQRILFASLGAVQVGWKMILFNFFCLRTFCKSKIKKFSKRFQKLF